jgi:hypothetical protein
MDIELVAEKPELFRRQNALFIAFQSNATVIPLESIWYEFRYFDTNSAQAIF